MEQRYRRFYFGSVLAVLIASAYPLYMGASALIAYLKNGVLLVEQYPKYIIPYTPLCVSLIIVVALMPLLYKCFKRWTFLASSALGVILFLILEHVFESLVIDNNGVLTVVESYQLYLCMYTPDMQKTLDLSAYLTTPVFRYHYFAIAIVILIAVISIVVGATRLIKEQLQSKKSALVAQFICTLLFIGLCVLACFTSFYRQPTDIQPIISGVLTGLFFIVLGLTVATITAGFSFKKSPASAIWAPVFASVFTTALMYYFEYLMLRKTLYRFGANWFFQSLGTFVLAPFDIAVIIVSGVVSYCVAQLIYRNRN